MKVRMDRVGRVVLPKAVRDQLGLEADSELDVQIEGTAIRLQPRHERERRIEEIDGWPVLAAVGGRTLTDDDVRDLRDADER